MERIERFRHASAAAGLEPGSLPVPVASDSNDVWLVDDARRGRVVLRVGWRGDLTRTDRESVLARHLPESVPCPEVTKGR